MHKSAYEIGKKFLDRYWNVEMENILEVGSLDVNGTLKDFKPNDSNWVGVDIEPGKGVDIVIEKSARLPFEDGSFDLIVATSIFEHDPMFWVTFNEMLRVTSDNGFIYVSAPSNGWVHRYPLDVYRFYPDAGIALEEWGRRTKPNLMLQESFISERDGDIWNDFTAVFSLNRRSHKNKIYSDTPSTNVWSEGVFLEETLCEATEDMRIIASLNSHQDNFEIPELEVQRRLEAKIQELEESLRLTKEEAAILEVQVDNLDQQLNKILNSNSWKITYPYRKLVCFIRSRFSE